MSGNGTNRGDSGAAENSVGGVEDLDSEGSDEAFEVEEIAGAVFSCDLPLLHLTHNVVICVLLLGDLNKGTEQPTVGHDWSVRTHPLSM